MSTSASNPRRLPVYLAGALTADIRDVYFVEGVPRGEGARIVAAGGDLLTKREVAAIPDVVGATGISIVVDATHVYWTTQQGIYAVPLGGGDVRTLHEILDLPWGLAQDETHLYVSMLGMYPEYERGGILAVPKAGGPARPLVAGRSATAVTVANGTVYWASRGSIWSAPASGGPAKRVVERARNPHSMLVREGLLYFGEFDVGGAVRFAPTTGGAPATLADAEYSCSLVAVGPWLYFTQSGIFGGCTVARIRFAGGSVEPLVFRETKVPRAASSSGVFFVHDDCESEIVAFDL